MANTLNGIHEKFAAAISLAGQCDGMLAQRLVGADAAVASATTGDTLNTPPPSLPADWTPHVALPDSQLRDILIAVAAELREAVNDGADVPRPAILEKVADAVGNYAQVLP